jgi:hypothetical protein
MRNRERRPKSKINIDPTATLTGFFVEYSIIFIDLIGHTRQITGGAITVIPSPVLNLIQYHFGI